MKVSERGLENAAVHYLRRFSSTEANLKRVLLRKIERARRQGDDRELPDGAVERVVSKMVETGLVDDAAYGRAWTHTLHRRGLPGRAIAQKLRQKGVPPDLIEAALERLAEESENPDLDAARAYASRRRLGPYRRKPVSSDDARKQREKDLRSMGRAGFGFGLARRVLDETLDEETGEVRAEW